MSGPAIAHNYRYPFASTLAPGSGLRLATSGPDDAPVAFFRGHLTRPVRAADLLRGLVAVVQSRFYVPPAMLGRFLAQADPVVTCGDDALRFEAFSACCGAYARVDFSEAAVEGERGGRGTTNVDFNAPMRAALAKVRDGSPLGLAIGADAVELSQRGETVVERKVALPLRWLKGFVEVQSYQSRMVRRLEIPGPEALHFLRALPRGAAPKTAWAVPAGRGLRLSQTAAPWAVRLGGARRLAILEPLARHARTLRVYDDAATGASAWELVLDEARFHLVITPDVSRGFSGEGQALAALASARRDEILPRVRASLRWESRIASERLAEQFGGERGEVDAALAALGSRGLVGFDLADGAYFHRELPFDLDLVESLHPRLSDARALVASDGVRIVRREAGRVEAAVRGTEVEHRVVVDGEAATCTCPWFAKHRGDRGPCKHALALQIALDAEGGDSA